VFLCCFVATSGALAAGTVPDGADSKTENERESLRAQVDGTDQIVIEIALQSDGSAKWRQEHRIKQQDVVQTLDWSETKTSEVVSDLRETDRVEVYRLGRNNVLALPGTGLGYESDDESGGEQS
jgi:hypothetical protein